ncbi:tumor necrosis factor ligand superfamily member 6 isoform X2 [Gambusia affinis]|uniref:tumor necrosis factor ligand superfamily member 6 isoform X2 n=1 Tax=Gambusia affinis TaxID=33528 RepID=UPI001CDC5E43|nr:tumor necrosis factor ligand superfamily member 6 isoform X2 [Gambusia affinis]
MHQKARLIGSESDSVFLVDEGGGQRSSATPPNLIPCWSFPQARETTRSHSKSRGCMGVSCSLAMILLMLFLLVFAALGFEAWQILRLQQKLKNVEKVEHDLVTEFHAPQKQIGLYNPDSNGEEKTEEKMKKPAAHVLGRIVHQPSQMTLRWEPKAGQAFTSGAVAYKIEDGALQVNESGLYHVYSRVELIFRNCHPTSSFDHVVFVRRVGQSKLLTLMEAHKSGFCVQKPNGPWTAENYLGGGLQLMKFDRVYVNVSHPTYLSHSHYGNFFGLYKI